MHLAAYETGHGLIGVVTIGHLVRGVALNAEAGVRAAVKERRHIYLTQIRTVVSAT
jgi:hypothetical protein